MTTESRQFATAKELRDACRTGAYSGPTGGLVPRNVLCNLVVLPGSYAYDFLVFCLRNPKPCPVIEVLDPGDPLSRTAAPGADLRTDLSRYAISRHGEPQPDVTDITDLWCDDSVALLMGSSLTFDHALERAGVPSSPEVWVLRSSIQTARAGRFAGPLVVTMRWMTPAQAIIATQLTARFAWNHGAPIHIGDPEQIGADLADPIWGRPIDVVPRRCGAGILGVWRDASVDRCGSQTTADDYACPGTRIRYRPDRRRVLPAMILSVLGIQ